MLVHRFHQHGSLSAAKSSSFGYGGCSGKSRKKEIHDAGIQVFRRELTHTPGSGFSKRKWTLLSGRFLAENRHQQDLVEWRCSGSASSHVTRMVSRWCVVRWETCTRNVSRDFQDLWFVIVSISFLLLSLAGDFADALNHFRCNNESRSSAFVVINFVESNLMSDKREESHEKIAFHFFFPPEMQAGWPSREEKCVRCWPYLAAW